MDLGADRRGVDMGPSAIRYARLERVARKIGHRRRPITATCTCRYPSRPRRRSRTRSIFPIIDAVCNELAEHRRGRGRERRLSAGARRRPLDRDRHARGRARARAAKRRADLGRRARRHQYACDLAVGQRARHAGPFRDRSTHAVDPNAWSSSACATSTTGEKRRDQRARRQSVHDVRPRPRSAWPRHRRSACDRRRRRARSTSVSTWTASTRGSAGRRHARERRHQLSRSALY